MPFDPNKLPFLASWLIKSLCKPDLQEEIEGNLIEYNQGGDGSFIASAKFWYQTITYLRGSTLSMIGQNSKVKIMFHFNIAQTIRRLRSYPTHLGLSIIGFTVSILCISFLYFLVLAEITTDKFIEDQDQIYRLQRTKENYNIGVTSAPFAQALAIQYPEAITASCRVISNNGMVRRNKIQYRENIKMVDSNFFQFFSYPIEKGDAPSMLDAPSKVVISKHIAIRYFGDENPIGKTLIIDGDNFIVSGQLQEFKEHSVMNLDVVVSLETLKGSPFLKNWWSNAFVTFLQIPSSRTQQVADGFEPFMKDHFGADFEKTGDRIGLNLEPFGEIYFNDETQYDFLNHGNKNSLRMMIAVCLAILFISSFNYLNSSMALALKRIKEVSIRKVIGTNRVRIILQFLGESLLTLLFATLLAIILLELILPYLNQAFQTSVVTHWTDPNILLFLLTLTLFTLLLSGLYPAIHVSSTPLIGITAKTKSSNNIIIRRVLVLAQFSISTFMIIATLIIGSQLDYVQSKALGFNKEALIIISKSRDLRENFESFKTALLSSSQILSVSSMSGAPGGFHDATVLEFSYEKKIPVKTIFTDDRYIETLGAQIKYGRDFSENKQSDFHHAAIINESAAIALGYTPKDVIGMSFKISLWDSLERKIIGVVEDYHFASLRRSIEPVVIIQGHGHWKIAVRLNTSNISTALDHVYASYDQFSIKPIRFDFLDNSIAAQYQNEIQQRKIVTLFSWISVLLSCLGIFGLVSFAIENKRKELGIRKTLGASVRGLLLMLYKEYLYLVIISILFALSLVAYVSSQWLSNFAYRISLLDQWYLFALGVLLSIALVVITIIARSYKVVHANPVDSLRHE